MVDSYSRADVLVVDRPESVEAEGLLVTVTLWSALLLMKVEVVNILLANTVHLIPVLVTDAVVDTVQIYTGQILGDRVFGSVLRPIPGQERSRIRLALQKGVGGLSIRLDSRNPNVPVLIFEAAWRRHNLGTVGHGGLIYCVDGVNFEGDVLDAVTVLFEVLVDLAELLLLFRSEVFHLVEGAERGG